MDYIVTNVFLVCSLGMAIFGVVLKALYRKKFLQIIKMDVVTHEAFYGYFYMKLLEVFLCVIAAVLKDLCILHLYKRQIHKDFDRFFAFSVEDTKAMNINAEKKFFKNKTVLQRKMNEASIATNTVRNCLYFDFITYLIELVFVFINLQINHKVFFKFIFGICMFLYCFVYWHAITKHVKYKLRTSGLKSDLDLRINEHVDKISLYKWFDNIEQAAHESNVLKEKHIELEIKKKFVRKVLPIFLGMSEFFAVTICFVFEKQLSGFDSIFSVSLFCVHAISATKNLFKAFIAFYTALRIYNETDYMWVEDKTMEINKLERIEFFIEENAFKLEKDGMIEFDGEKCGVLREIIGLNRISGKYNVMVNGVFLRKIDQKSLRKFVTYVSEDRSFFAGSLLLNIGLGLDYTKTNLMKRLGEFETLTALRNISFEERCNAATNKFTTEQVLVINLIRGILRDKTFLLVDFDMKLLNDHDRMFFENYFKARKIAVFCYKTL